MDNYKRVNTYCLPASLRPTLLQRFVGLRELVNQHRSDQTAQDNASWCGSSVPFGGLNLTAALESIIDAVLHPEIRDRMIMLRGANLPLFLLAVADITHGRSL